MGLHSQRLRNLVLPFKGFIVLGESVVSVPVLPPSYIFPHGLAPFQELGPTCFYLTGFPFELPESVGEKGVLEGAGELRRALSLLIDVEDAFALAVGQG